MNSAERASAPTSATTSGNAPPRRQAHPRHPSDAIGKPPQRPQHPDDAPEADLNESQFLQRQSELAKQAISGTFDRFSYHLKQGVSPSEWTREYPWISLGAAAVAGFFAATQLIPSKEEQALKKLAALERALHPAPVAAAAADGKTVERESTGGGILSGALRELVKVAQPIIMSALTAKVAANESEEAHEKGAKLGAVAATAAQQGAAQAQAQAQRSGAPGTGPMPTQVPPPPQAMPPGTPPPPQTL